MAQAEFTLEQARLRYAQEEARGEQARKEWSSLSKGEPSPLALSKPQLQAEAANVEWAQDCTRKSPNRSRPHHHPGSVHRDGP